MSLIYDVLLSMQTDKIAEVYGKRHRVITAVLGIFPFFVYFRLFPVICSFCS